MGGDAKCRNAFSSSTSNNQNQDVILKEINEEIMSLHEYLEKHAVSYYWKKFYSLKLIMTIINVEYTGSFK